MKSLNGVGWEEADLVAAARAGDLRAFDALVAQYRSAALIQACAITRQRELAEDAVQDSFLAAFKALPSLAEARAFGPWLGAIVRHRSIRLASGATRPHVPLDDVILAHTPALAADLETDRLACSLRSAIAGLGPELAPVLGLYYFDEWSVARIAAFLDLPRTTVKWRLHAGRCRLGEALASQGESDGTGT